MKNNCNLKIPFVLYDKKLSENQIIRLLDKGCTTNLKGFALDGDCIQKLGIAYKSKES